MTVPAHARTPADVLAEVDALHHLTPDQTAETMHMTTRQIARALHAAGRPRHASVFLRAWTRARRDARRAARQAIR